MHEQGHRPDRAYVKSARVVGDVMGKLPSARRPGHLRRHGPAGAGLLAERPAIDGHGNFGARTTDRRPSATALRATPAFDLRTARARASLTWSRCLRTPRPTPTSRSSTRTARRSTSTRCSTPASTRRSGSARNRGFALRGTRITRSSVSRRRWACHSSSGGGSTSQPARWLLARNAWTAGRPTARNTCSACSAEPGLRGLGKPTPGRLQQHRRALLLRGAACLRPGRRWSPLRLRRHTGRPEAIPSWTSRSAGRHGCLRKSAGGVHRAQARESCPEFVWTAAGCQACLPDGRLRGRRRRAGRSTTASPSSTRATATS